MQSSGWDERLVKRTAGATRLETKLPKSNRIREGNREKPKRELQGTGNIRRMGKAEGCESLKAKGDAGVRRGRERRVGKKWDLGTRLSMKRRLQTQPIFEQTVYLLKGPSGVRRLFAGAKRARKL